jgi:putative phosphoribosyl transferase
MEDPLTQDELIIPTDTTLLEARLYMPTAPTGLVIVAHGAFTCASDIAPMLVASDRGLAVATAELSSGLGATLRADERAQRDAMHVVGQRLVTMTRWLRSLRVTARLPLGFFACDVGAGAACAAAVACGSAVSCVATWQGRIDLVGHDLLERVRVPSLLMVSGRDADLLAATRMARVHLGGSHATKVLRGTSERANEGSLLAHATDYAGPWLANRLRQATQRSSLQSGATR